MHTVSSTDIDAARGIIGHMLESLLAYGYDLGGPGGWHLKGFAVGDPLCTDWYDERDATYHFPSAATGQLVGEVSDRRERRLAEEQLPYVIEEQFLTDDLDTLASPRYVFVISDSVGDLTDGEEPEIPSAYVGSDWDTMLDAALAELGLQASDRPRWLLFKAGSPG
jgi:hypothetical protein